MTPPPPVTPSAAVDKREAVLRAPTRAPDPAPPAAEPARPAAPPAVATPAPAAPEPAAPVQTSTRSTAAQQRPAGRGVHVVSAGDSLWDIASTRLGPDASSAEIAREVDRLWRLNAGSIRSGSPQLLAVGERLRT